MISKYEFRLNYILFCIKTPHFEVNVTSQQQNKRIKNAKSA